LSIVNALKLRWLLWRARVVHKLNRLDAIRPLMLGASLDNVVALYGAAAESGPDEDEPSATTYGFLISPFHEAIVTVWKGAVHQVTYWSTHPDPARDLAWMMSTYGEGLGWDVVTEGYSYRRKDAVRLLWCSAAPAIGVGSLEFREVAMDARRRKREAKDSA